jgi:hypothetical protein
VDRIDPKGKTKRRAEGGPKAYDWHHPKAEELYPIAPPRPKKPSPRPPDPSPPPGSTVAFSLAEQIDCVTREVSLRENTYPNQVAAGRLTVAEAARKIARMRSVLDTLINLQRMVDSLPRQGRS